VIVIVIVLDSRSSTAWGGAFYAADNS